MPVRVCLALTVYQALRICHAVVARRDGRLRAGSGRLEGLWQDVALLGVLRGWECELTLEPGVVEGLSRTDPPPWNPAIM